MTPSPLPSGAAVSQAGYGIEAMTLCIFFIILIPLAAAGLALINTGLGRSRSAAHTMLASLLVMAVAAVAYFCCGFALQGFHGRPQHMLTIGGKPWGWAAAEPLFLRGLSPDDASPAALAAWFGMLSAGLAAVIPLGTGADRWRLGASCISAALLAGLTFPLFAHWGTWGGGWLAQLGQNDALGAGFLDPGGGGAIQSVGGLTALSVAWILGSRRGKYSSGGMPAAIPGHNAVFVLCGCMLAFVGWLGLNCGSATLFTTTDIRQLPLVCIGTLLSAAGALIAAALITRARFGKPDASLCANGWVGGLAASSGIYMVRNPLAPFLVGIVAGALVTAGVEWFELRLRVDDPGGSISVHCLGGLWGILAAGIFVHTQNEGQWLAQLAGVATLIGFVLPLTYGLNWLLDRFHRQRVAMDGERQGMDLHELGAGAYPEMDSSNDEFMLE